jgi:hypothetical protein
MIRADFILQYLVPCNELSLHPSPLLGLADHAEQKMQGRPEGDGASFGVGLLHSRPLPRRRMNQRPQDDDDEDITPVGRHAINHASCAQSSKVEGIERPNKAKQM